MKKLLLQTLAILSCGASFALPIGNPAEPILLCDGFFCKGSCDVDICDFWCDPCTSWCDVFSLRVGFYGDYVFNRHMELQNFSNADIDDTEIYTNAGYIALNGFNRIDLFATLGASNLYIKTNGSAFGFFPAIFEVVSGTQFSWSVGGRASLVECGCWVLGIEGQYFSFCPNIKRAILSEELTVNLNETVDVKYHEWQGGVGLAYQAQWFVPYIGLKWAGARLDTDNLVLEFPFSNIGTFRDLKSKKLWGYAAGVTLVNCANAGVTVEGRYGDEKGVYVNGQFRF